MNWTASSNGEQAARCQRTERHSGLQPQRFSMRCDVSIWQFCDIARARFEHCATFDDKRQFLVEYVERVIYDRYR
jgi:hypothetical protein